VFAIRNPGISLTGFLVAPSEPSSLAEAAAGRHLAQLHRDPEALIEAAYLFLEGGLRRGNSVVIIATPANTERLKTRVGAGKTDPIEFLDAATVLEQCSAKGTPKWAAFRDVLGPVLRRAQTRGPGTRIYGDLAGMLWQDGSVEAAIRIEELWNSLGKVHAFALYCGYMLDTHSEDSYAGPLEEIGRTHTHIVGTSDDERFATALDRASKEIFGISLSQMSGVTKQEAETRFPSAQRTMLWVKRNLPSSTGRLIERARRYFQDSRP
jgi:hypothetical protein